MGDKLVLVLILGLCSPVFGTLNLTALSVFPTFAPLTSFTTLQQQITDFFTLTQSQLDALSTQLADRLGVFPFTPLNQSVINTVVQRILNVTHTLSPPPSLTQIQNFFNELPTILEHSAVCGGCQLFVLLTQLHVDFLLPILIGICEIYLALTTYTINNFCPNIVKINLPSLLYIRAHSKIMDPQLVCSILLQTKECYFQKAPLRWVGLVDSNAPVLPQEPVVDPSLPPILILHATDFHVSLNYEVGGVSDCGYPVCCLKGLGSNLKRGRAGYWGDYNCDVHLPLVTNALEYVKSKFNISYIYYTGDCVDHAVWNTTIATNKEVMTVIFDQFKSVFPNTPVFPVLGNHEAQPMNVFPPKEDGIANAGLDQQWLYDYAASLWSPWISQSALDSLKTNGYYSHNVSSKFKIIGLNNNLCYCYNWWLFYDTAYMGKPLDWLQNELLESERNGQKVHIISHNSMGNHECISPWEDTYRAIVIRFSHIIVGQFVGHTHTDELKVFYDEYKKPVGVSFNGASLTTYTTYNPNFKIIEVCPQTFKVRNIHTYTFNLTQANQNPNQSPDWFLLYSMKEQYNLPDLSPASIDQLSDRLAIDPDLLNTYWLNYVRYGDAAIKAGCNKSCKKDVLCKITRTQSRKPTKSYCSS